MNHLIAGYMRQERQLARACLVKLKKQLKFLWAEVAEELPLVDGCNFIVSGLGSAGGDVIAPGSSSVVQVRGFWPDDTGEGWCRLNKLVQAWVGGFRPSVGKLTTCGAGNLTEINEIARFIAATVTMTVVCVPIRAAAKKPSKRKTT